MVDGKMLNFESKRFRERFVKFVIGQAYFLIGCGYAFSGLMIPKLSIEASPLENGTAWIASSGLLLRPLISGADIFLIDVMGRQSTLRMKTLLIAVGWIIVTLSSSSRVFYVGRAITSLGLGFISDNAAYLVETDTKLSASNLESFSNSFVTAGILCSNVLQYFFSWRLSSFLIATLSCLLLLQIHYIPETKYWYMMKNRRREAIVTFLWFEKNGTLADAHEELNKIELNTLSTQNASFLEIFLDPTIIKPLIIYSIIVAARISTGYLIFVHYSSYFFEPFEGKYDVAELIVFMSIFNFAFTILFPSVISIYRQKTIFFASSVMMMGSISVLIFYKIVFSEDANSSIWIPFTCLLVYTTTNVAFFNPIVSLMLSEIMPKSWRMYVCMLQYSTEYKYLLVLVLGFPYLVANFGIESLFWLFLLSTVICYTVFVHLVRSISHTLPYESVNMFRNESNSVQLDRQELLHSMVEEESF